MASLAATLLCYYDEDTAFVMLVRMWQLRGLERLYQAGFNGLIQALGEFEHSWLSDSSVAAKLVRREILRYLFIDIYADWMVAASE